MQQSLQLRRQGVTRGRHWHSGESPIHLYKYRQVVAANLESVHRIRQLLVHGRIWVAEPSSLNDLHEMRFKLELDPDPHVRRA